jgi:hypothetical protein
MKHKSIVTLVLAGLVAALLAYTISGFLFKTGAKDEKVPRIEPIKSSLPDVRNESDYKTIFNDKALDPTLPVQIQGNNNNQPF